jgi:hypothetical protein
MTRRAIFFGLSFAIVADVGCMDGAARDAMCKPTTHLLDSSDQRIAANTLNGVGPFYLPDGGTITYTITDTPSVSVIDTMNVFIVSHSTYVAQFMSQPKQLPGYAAEIDVSSVTATTPELPVDSYDLAVYCFNLINDCLFHDEITALY